MRTLNTFGTINANIAINQGADFNTVIQILGMNGPVDLIGYKFLGEVKRDTAPNAYAVACFEFTLLDQALYPGQVQWTLTACETEKIMTSVVNALQRCRQPTPFLYDVKMEDTEGNVTRILQGTAFVSPEVTQEMFMG
jgi:hypothetical protein